MAKTEAATTPLPGEDLVERGLADLARHEHSLEALLVAVGAPRLRRLGFDVPARETLPERPEHALYDLLAAEDGPAAHSRYNALIRRLVSFERAVEFQQSRKERQSAKR